MRECCCMFYYLLMMPIDFLLDPLFFVVLWKSKSKLKILLFLVFFLSLTCLPSSLMRRAEEVLRMVTSAALFWHLSWTTTLIPLWAAQALMISSPTFLAFYLNEIKNILALFWFNGQHTKPRGPSLGARVAAGPASPPNTLMSTIY